MKTINGKTYISLSELKTHGFSYPPKGTRVVVSSWLFGYDFWYRFHEKKEGYESTVILSPFLSIVGQIKAFDNDVYVEFSPKNFKFEEVILPG